MIRPLTQDPDLADQVHATLLEAILSGELEAGQRYTQEGLAERLGVSRQPVIQALRLLRMQGLLVETPNRRGVTVAPLDEKFVAWLYELRAALDAAAARAAARNVRPDLKAQGEAILEEGNAAASSGRLDALVQADLRFHRFIYEAAENPLLLETARHHWHHTQRAMTAYVRRATAMKTVWTEHAAILEAIIAGNSELAAQLSHEHAANSAVMLLAGSDSPEPASAPVAAGSASRQAPAKAASPPNAPSAASSPAGRNPRGGRRSPSSTSLTTSPNGKTRRHA